MWSNSKINRPHMGRITLVCTAHREIGRCNERELLKILLAAGPEVIFEEIRQADLESIYADATKHNVEIRAIKYYLNNRKVQQVPVDDYEIPESFGPYMCALDDFVKSRSDEYCDIMNDIHQKQFEFGFIYLNSSEFISRIRESEYIYRKIVSEHGNNLAKRKLSDWDAQILKRDASMLENIYRFCQQTDFTEGVFLVGAGHMASIMDGIDRRMKDQPGVVAWKIWNSP
jgi:hypothetical protein